MSESLKLYKYRSWDNEYHRNLLTKNEVFMASPDSFNDPFDCRIPVNYLALDTEEKQKEFVHKRLRELEPHLHPLSLEFLSKEREGIRRMSNIEQHQRDSEILRFSEEDKRTGILCLTKRWDSILMWSHYGDFHQGISVGFHESAINSDQLFGMGGPVNYTNDFPMLNPLVKPSEEEFMESVYNRTFLKAKDWEYEEEYRLKIFRDYPLSKSDRVITLPDDCFTEINLGLKFPADKVDEVCDIAKEKNIPVFQVKKVPFKFELDREQIQ